ncbi:MAG: uracil-DNA glycosylase family protein [Spirochaetaceae bacterium]
MNSDSLHEYLNILNLTRDYLTDGWEKEYGGSIPSSKRGVEEVEEELASIAEEVSHCTRCRLSGTRTCAVPGEGPVAPKVMVIGEAPGAQEDETGRPFVGRAGQYLDKWLEAIGLNRERDVFIGNIIKCRPPNNRDPFLDEQEECLPFLQRQMDLLRPFAILTVGRIATHILTGSEESMGRVHGRTLSYRGTPLIPTYHPSGVLRNPQYRKPVWEDLKKLKRLIDGGE